MVSLFSFLFFFFEACFTHVQTVREPGEEEESEKEEEEEEEDEEDDEASSPLLTMERTDFGSQFMAATVWWDWPCFLSFVFVFLFF